ALRYHRVSRVTAAIVQADVRERRITEFGLRDVTSYLCSGPRDGAAQNYRKGAAPLFVEHARPDHPVDRVYTGGDHMDPQLILLRFRLRDIFVFQNLWATILVNDNGFHRGLVSVTKRCCCQRCDRAIVNNKSEDLHYLYRLR